VTPFLFFDPSWFLAPLLVNSCDEPEHNRYIFSSKSSKGKKTLSVEFDQWFLTGGRAPPQEGVKKFLGVANSYMLYNIEKF